MKATAHARQVAWTLHGSSTLFVAHSAVAMAGAGIGRFAGRLSKLVTAAGGKLEHGRYVARPGVALLAATSLAGDSDMLDSVLRAANVDTSRPDYEQMAELGGRLTYLAFPKEAGSGEDYNRRMAREHGHLSPFGVTSAT